MIRLVARWFRDFLWNEKSAAASVRSFITFLAAVATIVVASASDAVGGVNAEIIKQWDLKAWAIRIGAAALLAGAARIRSGEKNPTAEEIRAAAASPPEPKP